MAGTHNRASVVGSGTEVVRWNSMKKEAGLDPMVEGTVNPDPGSPTSQKSSLRFSASESWIARPAGIGIAWGATKSGSPGTKTTSVAF